MTSPDATTPNALKASLQSFRGIGPRRLEILGRLGLATAEDLLYYFPRDWQDRHETQDLNSPSPGGLVIVKATVVKASHFPAGPRLALFKAQINTGTKRLDVSWFKHQSRRFDVFASLKKDIVPGATLYFLGKSEPNLTGVVEIHVEEYYPLSDARWALHVERLVPIYALTEGITQRFLRELIHSALESSADFAPEILPDWITQRRALLKISQALRGIHFPVSPPALAASRNRLAYEELLTLELAWLLKRRQTRSLAKNFNYEIKRNLLTPFRRHLGFELTPAQKRVINEIFSDMQNSYPMTRLLQGDVGSGKTVVALSALLLAVENGYQGAFMAPTEILAEQHKATLNQFLKGLPVRTAILTSRTKAAEREKVISAVSKGEIDILVGTHSLLEETVRFSKLKLAVIDEQHRFGVRQRATLRQKSSFLDLLIMTATPIPRTLALALYGDLDVSTIDEMPPGKTTAETRLSAQAEALERIKIEAAKGRQAYIVYPIIEESSRLDLQSAKAEFDRLRTTTLANLKVALIHGAMPGKQKSKIMGEFAAGLWQVLVATPVIEVGIDVPNATVMVIQNADRFGLASLHQLRGRIGRGAAASVCFLVAEAKTEQAKARLKIMTSSNDGFRIGEEDLKLRGPGELLGMAQHGEVALKVADLNRDAALLAQARADAEELLTRDAKLLEKPHAGLRQRLLSLYQRQWSWIDLA